MSVIDTLVTDRTQEDVDRVRELKQKALKNGGISALTEEERAEYFDNPKGAYNYTDLNRVGEAAAYVYQLCMDAGLTVIGYSEPKTNWTVSDVPTEQQMNVYINNIFALYRASGHSVDSFTMDYLNYQTANDIEHMLLNANRDIVRLMTNWLYSGEFESGEF